MKLTDISGRVELSNGVRMPYFGLGVYEAQDGDEVINSIHWALEAGYRLFDTASFYQNERGVGAAIRDSDIPREELFITSKVWNRDQGYDSTLRAFEVSMRKLGLEYLDLYLIHWPVKGRYKETWSALEKCYSDGRIKAIGVSNFKQHHLEELISNCQTIPMINQMEYHPYLVQQELVNFCLDWNIRYQAWSPLMRGKVLEIKELQQIASKHSKSVVQVVLRWNLQNSIITIPKSAQKERIIANADIFDFELDDQDMRIINSLDRNKRIGPDPDNFSF